jgi:hypothetical protein
MAYLAFSEIGGASGAGTQEKASSLSALEWSVVALAERDSLASLRAPGRMALALGALFGTKTTTKLADERLEALRRIAVLSWHRGYDVPTSAIKGFLAKGFSLDQYELLAGSIATARAARRARRGRR